jgi:lantibiotic modifying enzyme
MWCNGAPGVGLVRLALINRDALADPRLRAEAEAAVAASLDYGLRTADNLCCGNFGRIDFLIEAGRVLERPDLLALAHAAAADRLALRRETGRFGLDGNDAPDFLTPSFFTGLAGIGYTFLRMAAPGKLPTVLTWS